MMRLRTRLTAVVLAAAVLGSALPAPAVAAYPRPGQTERVSVASDGSEGTGGSFGAAISADGRFTAFRSLASNLVSGDTNGTWDVFVHDQQTGLIERVSVASDGSEGTGGSFDPSISADGRYVAFHSLARNLVPGPGTLWSDVYVHDRETGTTELVSAASDGAPGDSASGVASISGDGRYVAFESLASNLAPGATLDLQHILLHDRQTGVTERVSVATGGALANDHSFLPAISADGRHVAFRSLASNLAPDDTNGESDVFVHDRQTGVTARVSVASDGTEGNHQSWHSSISAGGRYVAFESSASNLVPGDINRSSDVFVHDRQTGVTERVSVNSDGTERTNSFRPSISADGRYVAFDTFGAPPVLQPDVFVHDRHTGSTERVSMASDGTHGNNGSFRSDISADGRNVAFESFASNLVPGDTNGVQDIFVRDRGPAIGVGQAAAATAGDQVHVDGWATFSGQIVASAMDPPDDGAPGAEEVGAELTGVSLTHRTEQEDLLVRWQLASLPALAVDDVGFDAGAGAPGILYALAFDLDGTRYEVRAHRTGLTTSSPSAARHFALYRCEPDCVENAQLNGGIGTTGSEVRVSIPLSALAASEDVAITGIRAFTGAGEAAPGPLLILDEVHLPDASVPRTQVSLGIASPGTPESEVVFDTQAALIDGYFSATLDTAGLPSGTHDVWARGCLGEVCGSASVELTW